MTSIEALEQEIKGLRELMESKLDNLQTAVDTLAESVVSKLEHEHLEKRVTDLETDKTNMSRRLERVERIIWLVSGLFLLFIVPVMLFIVYRLLEHII